MSSSNIKSWADASSDSDSEDDRIAPPPSNLPGSAIANEAEDDAEFDDGGFPGKTLEDMPKDPPFTAFVGNLNRGMEGKEFRAEVERLLVDRGCQTESGTTVQLVGTRLINDRQTGQSKGFGYVEFGTPEELLAFLNLGYHQISGRNLKVDIAAGDPRSRGGGGGAGAERRRSGRGGGGGRGDGRNYDRQYSSDSYRSNRDDGPIDGSQFQGGRYSRSASNMSQGSLGGGRSGMPRNGSGMMKRSDSAASTGSASQRPSLKLAPRTKPLDGSSSASRSSIFGDAKPVDVKEVVEKNAAENTEKDDGLKKVTSSMSDLEVVKETTADHKEGAAEITAPPDAKDGGKNERSGDKTLNRKSSRGPGRGGDKPERNNSDRRRDGRKPGRSEGRGGRGDNKRNSERGGRTNGKESGKRPSVKSNGDAAKQGEAPVSSLAAAAAMPVKQETKAPPKKTNSFAAFMDDSDDE
ncbi:hypothetical protein ACHAXN_010380 [Cyclotella atomus]